MIKFLKKHKVFIFIALVVFLVYMATRLVNLMYLPIFTDEAIYLRWAQIAKNDANWRFISLTDGKQPLFVWLTMVSMKLISEPVLAGRLVSVFSGLIGLVFIYLLAKELFKKESIALFSVILFLLSPFSLFYQRLAIMDGLVCSLFLLCLYLEVLLVKKIRLDIALILGMSMGALMLTKTSGFFTIYLAPLTLLLFDYSQKKWKEKLAKFFGFGFISIVISQLVYSVLRLSPLFHMIAQKDTTFVYPLKEWLVHPFTFFQGNFTGLIGWVFLYNTWPVNLIVLAVIILSFRKYFKERWFLFLWFALPFVALALFGKVLYPRFIAFMIMPLLIFTASIFAEFEEWVKNKLYLFVIGVVVLIPLIIFNYQILFDITHAPLTTIDRGQYVNDWPSGWGVRETVSLLKEQAKTQKISIYTDGTFGLLPYAIELYMVYDPQVKITGVWPIPDNMPESMVNDSKKMKTYFVTNQIPATPFSWTVEEIGKWQKGANDKSFLKLYQVISR